MTDHGAPKSPIGPPKTPGAPQQQASTPGSGSAWGSGSRLHLAPGSMQQALAPELQQVFGTACPMTVHHQLLNEIVVSGML